MTTKASAERILIVDDDADTRESLKVLLETAGYEVEVAPNGSRALRLQHSRPADAVVTDIFMPVADGIETIRGLRTEFPDVRIIAVSAGGRSVGNETYLAVALAAGADAVLRKPMDFDELLAMLKKLLAGHSGPPDP
jgi:two-component system response regulator MprA